MKAMIVVSPTFARASCRISGTPYASGQTIEVKVPANTALSPTEAVKIIECGDPGGLPANLPITAAGCNTNTVNADTIIPNSDGSFDYTNYQVYKLPDADFPVGI